LPVRWENQDVTSVQREITRDTIADLCRVSNSGTLHLLALWSPNSLKSDYRGVTDLLVTRQAQAKECSSDFLGIAIDWDGKWDNGAAEMGRHLVIREQT
jgi:hypothetical protein